jgi:hypothetical protein
VSKFIFLDSTKIVQALYDAGVIDENFDEISRIVIDLKVGEPARAYVERYLDDEKLHAGLTAGLAVVLTEQEAGRTGMGAPKRKSA